MSRATAADRTRKPKLGSGAKAMGKLGQQVGGAWDDASATAQQLYDDAQAAYHDALHAAEQGYEDARVAAEQAYEEAQRHAETLAAESRRLYDEALRHGQHYRKRTARFTGDNKALAIVLAGGVGYLIALAFKRK
jgi:ElaB/YqjD/DUF883 family membrane-anchored ribosome-binding protein